MNRIDLYEARLRLSALMKRVAQGERFVILRRGVPVAELGPVTRRKVAIIQLQVMHEQVRKYGGSSLVNQPIGRILAADECSGVTKKEQRGEAVANEPVPTFTAVPDGQVDEE
jgi:antitoxin (DNA-binding transcriptional repressor) of toxin-antitoxin stability system